MKKIFIVTITVLIFCMVFVSCEKDDYNYNEGTVVLNDATGDLAVESTENTNSKEDTSNCSDDSVGDNWTKGY